jgi:DNA repair photolyase
VAAKSALNHVPSASAMPFDWTVNPYRGCSHACSYCFARGTHAYLDLDAGRDFDEQIVVKVNVAEVLRRELAAPSWQHEPGRARHQHRPVSAAEGRRLMPEIIDTLAASGAPFSVLTRARCCGAIFRCSRRRGVGARPPRDVGRHARRAVAATLEAGAPTFQARLDTVRAATGRGSP